MKIPEQIELKVELVSKGKLKLEGGVSIPRKYMPSELVDLKEDIDLAVKLTGAGLHSIATEEQESVEPKASEGLRNEMIVGYTIAHELDDLLNPLVMTLNRVPEDEYEKFFEAAVYTFRTMVNAIKSGLEQHMDEFERLRDAETKRVDEKLHAAISKLPPEHRKKAEMLREMLQGFMKDDEMIEDVQMAKVSLDSALGEQLQDLIKQGKLKEGESYDQDSEVGRMIKKAAEQQRALDEAKAETEH